MMQAGCSGNTPDFYAGVWFKSWPGHWLPWLRFFGSFPLFLQANARPLPQIRPWMLSSTSFPVHYSLSTNFSTLYSPTYQKSH